MDILKSAMQTITIPVNTVGVMGKGLALAARNKYPEVYPEYRKACKDGLLKIGFPYLYKGQKWLLLFPTKQDWREKSKLEYIESGLIWLLDNYKSLQIKSIAIPALGCGLGGLEWTAVYPLMIKYLNRLDIPFRIYPPTKELRLSLDKAPVEQDEGA